MASFTNFKNLKLKAFLFFIIVTMLLFNCALFGEEKESTINCFHSKKDICETKPSSKIYLFCEDSDLYHDFHCDKSGKMTGLWKVYRRNGYWIEEKAIRFYKKNESDGYELGIDSMSSRMYGQHIIKKRLGKEGLFYRNYGFSTGYGADYFMVYSGFAYHRYKDYNAMDKKGIFLIDIFAILEEFKSKDVGESFNHIVDGHHFSILRESENLMEMCSLAKDGKTKHGQCVLVDVDDKFRFKKVRVYRKGKLHGEQMDIYLDRIELCQYRRGKRRSCETHEGDLVMRPPRPFDPEEFKHYKTPEELLDLEESE